MANEEVYLYENSAINSSKDEIDQFNSQESQEDVITSSHLKKVG